MAHKNATIENYQSYRGLPPLVGLHTMSEVADVGLSVEQSVERLKRAHWAMRRLHEVFVSRLTAIPVYELKMAFSLHSHYCAEHVAAFRTRVREMSQPPYGLDNAPHDAIELLFDEILGAPTDEALLLGLYSKAVPALVGVLEKHLEQTHRLFDHPTYRVLRFALVEMKEIAEYGQQAIACMAKAEQLDSLEGWLVMLDECLASAGGLDGTGASTTQLPTAQFSVEPFVYDGVPQRDERFKDSCNMWA